MLLDHGATVDFRDGDGLTPLMLNVGALRSYRSEAIIKALVEAGADVHARDGRGRTPLMYAAKTTRRTYEYLLGQGADPETVDGKGKSAQMRVRSFVVDEDGSPYGREKEPFDDYDMR
ncbi:ankyrin repeat-containing domain protein [Aspergillus multicolor]|uniref:ankyrin repeat domain-containing protein n=1 Tax=Aspergillus multicolor TaxID=41759 RepID=UPI003CCC906B